jgi:hypothetical protein
LVGVNHILAHGHAAQLVHPLEYPYLALIVSGGHSQAQWVEGPLDATIVAATIDDAVGEAYDKVHRMLRLEELGLDAVERVLAEEERRLVHDAAEVLGLHPHSQLEQLGFAPALLDLASQPGRALSGALPAVAECQARCLEVLSRVQRLPLTPFTPQPQVGSLKGLLSQELPSELAYIEDIDMSVQPPAPGTSP